MINFEINLQLKWFKRCILVSGTAANQLPDLKITVTKLYGPVATLSTQENVKLGKQLEFSFKRQIYWNSYQSKKTSRKQIYRFFN